MSNTLTEIFVACAGEFHESSDVIGVFTNETDAIQRCRDTPRTFDNHYDTWWVEVWEYGATQRTRMIDVRGLS